MNLSEAVELYLVARSTVRSDKTRSNHRKGAAKVIHWLGRDPDLTELDDITLGRYFDQRGKQVAANTVKTEAQNLTAVLKWAARKRWCEYPDYQPPRVRRKTPKALTVDQLSSLLEAAAKLTGDHDGIPACVRWRAYLSLSVNTAERIGAVRALAWPDIDGEHVTFRERKGHGSEETHRLLPATVDALNALRAFGEPRPFAWLHRTKIYAHWHAMRQIAELPEWVRPHTLRATVASHCDTLADAQRMLRHLSPATTAKHYRDPRVAKDSTVPSALAKALENPKRRGPFRWLGWAG